MKSFLFPYKDFRILAFLFGQSSLCVTFTSWSTPSFGMLFLECIFLPFSVNCSQVAKFQMMPVLWPHGRGEGGGRWGEGGGQPNVYRPGQEEEIPKSPIFVRASFMDDPYRKKRTGNQKIGMMKFLALTLYLLATITLTLISSSAIIGCFQNVNFQRFSLVI